MSVPDLKISLKVKNVPDFLNPAKLVADSEKIRKELGWKPKYEDIETIITTAWNWHQKELR